MRTSARTAGGGGRNRHAMPPSSGHEKLRRHPAAGSREVLRRALMPASRRPSLRRWNNFRPTPSRLCNMSMAAESM
ncbi:unnamed protein product [Linum tenue]|uniref:Uncharacterized protein n=1 Tax=Linum tenue TaxID=586396 RepID=A0AAV0LY54_9ROSI|nr:unnamed protein product [Linum tenue]